MDSATKAPAKWAVASVNVLVRGPEGDFVLRPVTGYVRDDVPGLALTPDYATRMENRTWWNVTHVASGNAAGQGFDSREIAACVAFALAPLADWTKPASFFMRLPKRSATLKAIHAALNAGWAQNDE